MWPERRPVTVELFREASYCGGTHVARTAEIGRVRVDRIEKKGRQNRCVAIAFAMA